jgi:PAS domain S-box-containing protein/putative nucleotidyltransferase with HDIG domain
MKKNTASTSGNQQSLRALIVDDSEDDVLLVIHELKKGGYNPVYERVETAGAMEKSLQNNQWDIILCDYKMPDFSAPSAIAILKKANIDIPIIITSGTIGEDTAVECMHSGAQDYIMKGNFSRLCPAIARELEETKSRNKQKQAEESLRQSEELYTRLVNAIPDIIVRTDLGGNILFANDYTSQISGYSREEIQGRNILEFISHEDHERVIQDVQLMIERYQGAKEYNLVKKGGNRIPIEVNGDVLLNEDGTPFGLVHVCRDISERKLAEEKLKERDILFKKLSDNVPGMIYQFLRKPDETYCVPFSTEGIKDIFGCSPEDVLDDFSPITGVILPEDIDKLINSIEYSAKNMTHWQFEYRVHIPGQPLRWVMSNSTPEKLADGSVIWHGFTTDITESKRMNAKLQHTLDSLRKAFSATIQVLVSAVEMRDPYTAGHQARTADIARAIATEMGLPQEKVDGIRMAGTIHDIGKLSIPAEILSKPTKLTDIEFSLIKEHPHIGYEILKDIESPWELAEIVYQHHERMDGSGYPRKLKGDEIIMEARIMAVADVVEAMASHRPYRAALGIEAALEEIEKNKGIFYDITVADACLRLFQEKGYKLP